MQRLYYGLGFRVRGVGLRVRIMQNQINDVSSPLQVSIMGSITVW